MQSAIRIAAPGPKRHAIALEAVSSRFVQLDCGSRNSPTRNGGPRCAGWQRYRPRSRRRKTQLGVDILLGELGKELLRGGSLLEGSSVAPPRSARSRTAARPVRRFRSRPKLRAPRGSPSPASPGHFETGVESIGDATGEMTKASSIGGNVTPSKATSSTAPRRAVTRPSIVLVCSTA